MNDRDMADPIPPHTDVEAFPAASGGDAGGDAQAHAHAQAHGWTTLSRRGFLRGVAGGGAAIAVAGWLPAGGASYPAPQRTLEALTAKEHAIVRAAAEALLADVPVDPGHVADELDRELALMGEPILGDMKAVLGLLEHLTILGGHLRPFTALAPSDRLAYLNGWATSRFNLRRAAFQGLRSLVHFIGWADDATRPLTGYQGTWPERFDHPAYPVDFGGVA